MRSESTQLLPRARNRSGAKSDLRGRAMLLRFGPKQWTWHQQHGLRLYAGPIRRLAPHVSVPDRRRIYRTMQDFVDAIGGSRGNPRRPRVYSRRVLIVQVGARTLRCTASFSDNTDRRPAALACNAAPSLQGYITAPTGTWFRTWVTGRIGRNLIFEYLPGTSSDVVIIP
jgi:hypothetical protein